LFFFEQNPKQYFILAEDIGIIGVTCEILFNNKRTKKRKEKEKKRNLTFLFCNKAMNEILYQLYFHVLFFIALYVLGDLIFGKLLQTAPLIGHIFVGVLFVSLPGNTLLGEIAIMEILGSFGILMCIFEGGFHVLF